MRSYLAALQGPKIREEGVYDVAVTDHEGFSTYHNLINGALTAIAIRKFWIVQ